MSEANNVWRVEVAGTEHEIELEHSHSWKEKLTIKVDGQVIEQGSSWRGTDDHEFEVGGERAKITIDNKYGGFAHGSSLHLGDRYVEPLQQ